MAKLSTSVCPNATRGWLGSSRALVSPLEHLYYGTALRGSLSGHDRAFTAGSC